MNNQNEITLEHALEAQAKQIAEWKRKLVPTCYKALVAEAENRNTYAHKNTVEAVWRGYEIEAFIRAWKSGNK